MKGMMATILVSSLIIMITLIVLLVWTFLIQPSLFVPKQPQLHWKEIEFNEIQVKKLCGGTSIKVYYDKCKEDEFLEGVSKSIWNLDKGCNVTLIRNWHVLFKETEYYPNMDATIEMCSWEVAYEGLRTEVEKTPTLTIAYCDDTPEECGNRYGKVEFSNPSKCPCSIDYSIFCNCVKVLTPAPFKCENWQVLFYTNVNGTTTNTCCTQSALYVNGSCNDAIKQYGGVCDG